MPKQNLVSEAQIQSVAVGPFDLKCNSPCLAGSADGSDEWQHRCLGHKDEVNFAD